MKEKTAHFVDILFVLAIFGLFAISALAIVTIGANVYQNTVDHMQTNYEIRTSSSYLMEKVRQNSTVTLSEVNGQTVLCLPREIGGQPYATYLYCYDGELKELFTSTSANFGSNMLGAGQNIMPLKDLSFHQLNDSLIETTITFTDGLQEVVYLPTCE